MTKKKKPISPARLRRACNPFALLQARVAPITEANVLAHMRYYQRAVAQLQTGQSTADDAHALRTLVRLVEEIDRRAQVKDASDVIPFARAAMATAYQRCMHNDVWTPDQCTPVEIEALEDLLVLFELQLRNNSAGLLHDAMEKLKAQARTNCEPLEEIYLEEVAP